MKKLIVTACAAIASAVAVASTVESSNTFGVLKVQLKGQEDNNRKQYFIGVPWDKVGGGDGGINPTELVLPTGLSAGDDSTNPDKLYYYGASSFAAWEMTSTGWAGVESHSSTITSAPQGNEAVVRGQGLVLETAAQYVFLSGQYATGGSVTIANNAYTILGGAEAKEYVLSTSGGATSSDDLDVTWSRSPTAGDTIFVTNGDGNTVSYVYLDGVWKGYNPNYQPPTDMSTQPSGSPYIAAQVVIPQGKGAWYSSKATTGDALTLTFK